MSVINIIISSSRSLTFLCRTFVKTHTKAGMFHYFFSFLLLFKTYVCVVILFGQNRHLKSAWYKNDECVNELAEEKRSYYVRCTSERNENIYVGGESEKQEFMCAELHSQKLSCCGVYKRLQQLAKQIVLRCSKFCRLTLSVFVCRQAGRAGTRVAFVKWFRRRDNELAPTGWGCTIVHIIIWDLDTFVSGENFVVLPHCNHV